MVAPPAAGVGDAVIGSAFGVSEQTGAEFPVKAIWNVSAPGYFRNGHTGTHLVSFSSDDPESVQVTAVNNGPRWREGSASAQFVKVVSIEAVPAIVCVGNSNIAYAITTAPTGFEYMVRYTPADTSTPGVKEVIATCGLSAATCTVTVVRVEIKKPSGDPANPNEADAWNERSYDGGMPGIVTVECEAEETPKADNLRWNIADVGEKKAKWEPHVEGDEYTGKGQSATAIFTGLPAANRAFGPKIITLTMDESGITSIDTQEVEIFF